MHCIGTINRKVWLLWSTKFVAYHAVDGPSKIVVPPDFPLRGTWFPPPPDKPWRLTQLYRHCSLTLSTVYTRNPASDPSCKLRGDEQSGRTAFRGDHLQDDRPYLSLRIILKPVFRQIQWWLQVTQVSRSRDWQFLHDPCTCACIG